MPQSHGEGNSLAPTTKVKAGGAGAAASLLVVFIAGQAGVEISAEVASTITTLITLAAAYFKRDAS